MAENYSLFSEQITDLTAAEATWVRRLMTLDAEKDQDRQALLKELPLASGVDMDGWPGFSYRLECGELWLYSEEYVIVDHLEVFLRAFITKFRPESIFSITGADTCSKPRVGEFGGWWMVVSKDKTEYGNTYDAATEAVASLGVK